MQCIVFTRVVTITQCGCGGEAHFRCRRGSCLPDVSKLQQNMGGRPELGLSRSKAKSIFVQTNKKKRKITKNKISALPIRKKDWKKKDPVSTLLKAGWTNYSSFLVCSGKLLGIFLCPQKSESDMVGRGPIPVPSKALADQLTSLPADQFARKMEIS